MTHLIPKGGEVSLNSGRSESDILFCCASFEPRSTSVLNELTEDYHAETGILYYNKELQDLAPDKLSDSLRTLKAELGKYCDHIRIAEGSIEDPILQLNQLRDALSFADNDGTDIQSITVDITTFNREALLTLLNLLNSWYSDAELDILYASPLTYGDWLSRGHKNIRNVVGLTGSHNSGQSSALIVLSGFESDRTYKIIEEMEPAVVHLGYGSTPTQQKFLERNKHRQEMVNTNHETFPFDFATNDIDACRDVVDDLVSEHIDDHNIILAPMSTKLSTVGCWKVAQDYPSSQVIYSLPAEYNYEDYSEGFKDIYSDSFHLGR